MTPSLSELCWLWLKHRQQRAAGVKSSVAWMSIPAHQELICAPVCRNSTCHLHNPVNEGIETFKRCEMLINCPARRWLHKQHDNFNCSFLYKNVRWKEGGGGTRTIRSTPSSWLCLWNKIPSRPSILPLWYNLVGIREVAVDVFHLEGVSVTDLVVSPAVVGCLDHNDITPRAAEINCISLTRELPPDQPERQGRAAEPWHTQRRNL